MHRFTLCTSMVCLFLLGDCGPRFGGSSGTKITSYSQPPLYSDVTDVTKIRDGRERITTYKSKASPDIIHQFYVSRLAEQGWQKTLASTPGYEFYTISGEKSPIPFELLITVRMARGGGAFVELRQRVSGVYGWPDE
jgi:hypothetical protein